MNRALFAFLLLFVLTGAGGAFAAAPDSSSSQPSSASSNSQSSSSHSRYSDTQSLSSDMRVGQWLAKAADAVRTGSYRGVMVYLRREQLDALRIVHRFHDGVEQERLLALTGRPREIIRRGSRVISILPANEVVLITHQQQRGKLLSRVSQFTSQRLQAHYDLKVLGSRRLADRPTRVISIRSEDKYRYGYRILIDKKTHLPLKLNLIYQGKVLEQLMFTEIAYPEHIPASVFEPSYDIDGYRVIDQKSVKVRGQAVAQIQWHATRLPPGFELVETGVRTTSSGHVVRQLLFSDGVATVSAFIAPAGVPKPLIGGTTMGAVNAYGLVNGSYHITAVGEVPAVTVRMIARNLVHEGRTTASTGD